MAYPDFEYHETQRTAKLPKWYEKKPAIDTTLLTKIYLGIVRDARDPQRMGRILVWIPELSGESDKEENWVICSYCSPFAGASFFNFEFHKDPEKSSEGLGAIADIKARASSRTPQPDTIKKDPGPTDFSGRQSYGMWFTPPDVGNEVLIAFVNGDPNFGIWFGCLYQQDLNHMIPGVGQDTIHKGPDSDVMSNETGPVIETDLSVSANTKNKDNPDRRMFKPLRDGLKLQQGLDNDGARGQSTSSARRESPSQVFGILTPNGSQFVMDDGEPPSSDPQSPPVQPREFIRLRTKGGAQLLIDQTDGFVYAISRDGRTWLELSDKGDGNFDIYTSGNISIHAEKGDINLKAGLKDINIQAERDINIVAGKNIRMLAGQNFDTLVQGNISTESQAKISSKAAGDYAINSDSEIGITAVGNLREQASNVFMNSGPGPQSDAPSTPPSYQVASPSSPPEASDSGRWEPGAAYPEGSNIISRVPQHEPWIDHNVSTQGVNRKIVESPRDSSILSGASIFGQLIPNDIVLPDTTRLIGQRFNSADLPEYIQVANVLAGDLSPVASLGISQSGLDLIKKFEGSENRVYLDATGLPTIGIGHLITEADRASGRFANGFITDAEVDELLREDLANVETAVRGCVNQPLTNNQYDALVSMAFNIGNTGFCNSTLVKRINEGNYQEVPNEMQRWDKARVGGTLQPLQGLTNRRVAEARLFAKNPAV